MEAGLISALIGSGPLGLLILYLMNTQKVERDRLAVERARRDVIEKDRIDTDKALVGALTGLSLKIESLGK